MSELILRLNPALDRAVFAEAYARDGLVQIPEVFEPAVAEQIGKILETTIPWEWTLFGADGRPKKWSIAEMTALGPQGQGQEIRELLKRSSEHYGFMYFSYGMISGLVSGKNPDHPIHQLTEFLNSPEFLDFGRFVIGDDRVTKADAQATLYRPGDFIGLHDDNTLDGVERSAAYTLGFTRRWRSDWGGQTVFHDDRGDISRGLSPRWNTLTLFKVPRLHSVAAVAAHAQAARMSVIGWLRRDA